ncbi:MFS transporter [Paraburkholderia tropica]|uniref:MFS transporter n=1 Tax=Paraburkholderia tropica TaxID=92647 RepID=UPI002AB182B3|nr:MFS transporter [Paraburkholderia tropica]
METNVADLPEERLTQQTVVQSMNHQAGILRNVSPAELRRVVIASLFGSFVEFFEFSIYGYLAAFMGKVFFPGSSPSVQLITALATFAIAFLSRPFGGIVFGSLGDRYGRKMVLTWSILLMAFATFATGLLPSYNSMGVASTIFLIILRLLQGFSAGGEASGASIFVAEYCRDRNRTALTSWIEVGCMSGNFLGAAIAAVITFTFSPAQITDWAWRLPFLLALPIGAIGLYIRYRLEETPAFELVQKAREERVEKELGWSALFSTHVGALLQSGGIIIVTNVTFYTVVIYMPTYLVSALKLRPATGFGLTLGPLLFLVCAIPVLGRIADRISRKRMMLAGCSMVIALAIPCMQFLMTGDTALRILALGLLNLSLAMFLSCVYAVIPSLFEAKVRFKGMALSYNVAVALFAGTAPMINTWLIEATGSKMVPAYYMMLAAVVGIWALLSSTDRTGVPMRGDVPNREAPRSGA